MLSGVELVTNGGFTGSAAGWVLGTGWAYSADTMVKNVDGIGTCSQTVPIVVGKRYRLNFWISGFTVGTVTPSIGGFTGTARGANGHYKEIFVASSTADLAFTPTNTARFTLDTVSVQEVTGYEGLGWQFDGVDDVVNVTDAASLRIYGDLTILVWLRWIAISNYYMIVTKLETPGLNNSYELRIHPNGTLEFVHADASVGHGLTGNTVIPTGIWNCVGVVRKSLESIEFFLKGISDGVNASTIIPTGLGDLKIGARVDGFWLEGAIGEVLIFNRALSAQEIRSYFELTRSRYGV